MAVEKAKVKAALDAKFKGKSVSKEMKESYAARWAQKIETDDDIQTYVDDREDDILDAAKEADRRATAAEKVGREKAAQAASGNPEGNKDEPTTTELPDDTPGWAKALLKQNEALSQEVAGLKAARTAETLTERFKKDERLKGIPEIMFKGRIPTKDEDYETAVEDLAADYKTFAETHKLTPAGAGLGKDNPPGGGSKTGSSDSVSAEIEAWGKANAPKPNS